MANAEYVEFFTKGVQGESLTGQMQWQLSCTGRGMPVGIRTSGGNALACRMGSRALEGRDESCSRQYGMYLNPFIWLILELISLYTYVVIAAVIVSWLIAFGVINTYNRYARGIVQFLDAVTEPVFRQVRKVIPPIGGLDLSPLIVLIALQFLSYLISYYSIYL